MSGGESIRLIIRSGASPRRHLIGPERRTYFHGSRAIGPAGEPTALPAPVSLLPYAVRISTPAARVLAELPEHAEETLWDLLDAAAADPWGFGQWDPEGEDVRIASAGRLSVICFARQMNAGRAVHARW